MISFGPRVDNLTNPPIHSTVSVERCPVGRARADPSPRSVARDRNIHRSYGTLFRSDRRYRLALARTRALGAVARDRNIHRSYGTLFRSDRRYRLVRSALSCNSKTIEDTVTKFGGFALDSTARVHCKSQVSTSVQSISTGVRNRRYFWLGFKPFNRLWHTVNPLPLS